MNYEHHYNLLIDKAKNRQLTGYIEKHHIIPKCLGGKDVSTNLIELTASEHYVAHQLLVKIYPNDKRLKYALVCMIPSRNNQERNNKTYEWIRKLWSKSFSGENHPMYGKNHSEETKKKMSNTRIGKKHSDKTKEKIKLSNVGLKRSTEAKNNMSLVKHLENHPMYGKNNSEETKKKRSLSLINYNKNKPNRRKKYSYDIIIQIQKLYFDQNKNYRQIQQIMNIPYNSVITIINRLR